MYSQVVIVVVQVECELIFASLNLSVSLSRAGFSIVAHPDKWSIFPDPEDFRSFLLSRFTPHRSPATKKGCQALTLNWLTGTHRCSGRRRRSARFVRCDRGEYQTSCLVYRLPLDLTRDLRERREKRTHTRTQCGAQISTRGTLGTEKKRNERIAGTKKIPNYEGRVFPTRTKRERREEKKSREETREGNLSTGRREPVWETNEKKKEGRKWENRKTKGSRIGQKLHLSGSAAYPWRVNRVCFETVQSSKAALDSVLHTERRETESTQQIENKNRK